LTQAAASALRLPLRRRLGYGVGDLAFNLYFTTANLFLLLYYTDVLGLSPSTGGLIFATAMIWDALIDPVMGYIASRTKSRWGRYRPYLLFGSIPLAASWALIFLPTSYTGTALTLYALAAHMLFRTCYTIVSMPYLSLSSVMTSDSQERGVLASFRMIAATGGGLLIAFFTLKLVGLFGADDQMRGFLYTAILFGTAATIILFITFATTKEAVHADDEVQPALSEVVVMLRRNRAFWLVSGWLILSAVGSTIFGKSVPYFFKYDVGRADLIGPALATMTASAMIGIPIWTVIMRATSKRTVCLIGAVLAVTGYLTFWLTPPEEVGLLIGSLALLGVAGGAGYLTFWAMVPDTVEYGEWRCGTRADGLLFGLICFIQKAALGIAVGVLGQLLSWIGYTANETQTQQTLVDLRLLMVAAPVVCGLASAAFIFFYPLDAKTHGRVVRVIDWRKRRAQVAA
jgi:glycoside/pentoside/hexuronide:cation symporter, GPH family